MKKKIELCYEELKELLIEILPIEWDKVWFRFEIDKFEESGQYFVLEHNSERIMTFCDMVDNGIIDDNTFDDDFEKMTNIGAKIFNTDMESGSPTWTCLTFLLDKSGAFNIEYSYDDLNDLGRIERKINWIRKYLVDYPEYIETL